ncbi:eukaryotic translation initiation factor 4E [Encephalitozoon intestinalis ATCC 50506]|uniref:Eukaryotic translation initiation factor 4E n=1 Tax=Encephalitozoon intestinalis (strain ATCC 50506) TaxID=876142 RepID=E0SA01_ENCIT|nr:eukaryotic translation initiation factor 4E [Encephalitozoon intestinalis ATCC 50506]ADM12623.1 eukaryotic translation initiation factor 4E [Encephalitozoon intestinalis ATCC 50506]UTX46482.1 eukaryotic translation initiation factor 4E [Encephalitozoon intestinalis]
MNKLPSRFHVTLKVLENSGNEISKDTYEKDLKSICTLESQEHVSYLLHHLKDFDKIDKQFYINVFKEGISPVWEDENNMNGCDWSLMLKKEVCQRYFERLLVNLCTGYFKTFEPTGIVGIHKDNRFKLSIWSKNIPSTADCGAIINELKAALEIDFVITFHYKNHSKILAYHKSLDA